MEKKAGELKQAKKQRPTSVTDVDFWAFEFTFKLEATQYVDRLDDAKKLWESTLDSKAELEELPTKLERMHRRYRTRHDNDGEKSLGAKEEGRDKKTQHQEVDDALHGCK